MRDIKTSDKSVVNVDAWFTSLCYVQKFHMKKIKNKRRKAGLILEIWRQKKSER